MVGENRGLINSIRQRQKNWLGHVLRVDSLLRTDFKITTSFKSQIGKTARLHIKLLLRTNRKCKIAQRRDASTARWLYWGGAKNFRPPHLPCILCRAEGVLFEVGIGAGVKKTRMMGLPGREKSLTISSACGYNGPTWQTDTGRQQRPRLRIASRGKNGTTMSFST